MFPLFSMFLYLYPDFLLSLSLYSLFFSDRLASDSSGGMEVIPGTPLRMPTNPEFKSFIKIINQVKLLFDFRDPSTFYLS
jgi:hypothetical protein